MDHKEILSCEIGNYDGVIDRSYLNASIGSNDNIISLNIHCEKTTSLQ